MDLTLINPPEKLRVWAGIPKAHAHGVYCFPPLGLMYIQAAVEKRSHYKAAIPSTSSASARTRTRCPTCR
jgi:hypothetical protein